MYCENIEWYILIKNGKSFELWFLLSNITNFFFYPLSFFQIFLKKLKWDDILDILYQFNLTYFTYTLFIIVFEQIMVNYVKKIYILYIYIYTWKLYAGHSISIFNEHIIYV